MKKTTVKKKKSSIKNTSSLSIENSLIFLEDMQKLQYDITEPTISISLRIPKNILRLVKAKAQKEEKKYQTLIVSYIRQGLKANDN